MRKKSESYDVFLNLHLGFKCRFFAVKGHWKNASKRRKSAAASLCLSHYYFDTKKIACPKQQVNPP